MALEWENRGLAVEQRRPVEVRTVEDSQLGLMQKLLQWDKKFRTTVERQWRQILEEISRINYKV